MLLRRCCRTHTTAHDVPLSVAPEVGCVIATVNPPVGQASA